ncbi:hypothetical protein EI94DRAFT_1804217 [Lactarius quietus]|nr:hypothetical protein EI94DRAFT_1804217 [Lactarius quietus]
MSRGTIFFACLRRQRALLHRKWFDALKRDQGFNIELIQEDLLRAIADELNNAIRDSENAVHDRENAA